MTALIATLASTKEAFQLLEEAHKEVGLVVNNGQTKYTVEANTQNCSKTHAIEMGRYNSERVESFTYLGSMVNGYSLRTNHKPTHRSRIGLKSQLKS